MSRLQRFVLALVLVPVGFLAGTDVFEMMGNMPAVGPHAAGDARGLVAGAGLLHGTADAVFATSMFVLFLVAIGCFWRERRRAIFPTLPAS